MCIDSFTVCIVFPKHIVPDTSTMTDDEYMVKVHQWLEERAERAVDNQSSTEGIAVFAYVVDDKDGDLFEAWRNREALLAKRDLRLTPGQMKWLDDRAPQCPIKYDHTDLLVKPSSSAGFDEKWWRNYVVHELSKMSELEQVCNGCITFCLNPKGLSIKCPFTRESIPLGRALIPPYNEINRKLKVTCGKAAASAFAKFIKVPVPTADDTFRGDLELLCTKHNLTPDMFIDRKEDTTSGTGNPPRQLQKPKESKGKEPEKVFVISSDDEDNSAAAAAPKTKRRRVSRPKWLSDNQILLYIGSSKHASGRPLKDCLCQVVHADERRTSFKFISDGVIMHTFFPSRVLTRITPAIQKALDGMDDDQAGPAL